MKTIIFKRKLFEENNFYHNGCPTVQSSIETSSTNEQKFRFSYCYWIAGLWSRNSKFRHRLHYLEVCGSSSNHPKFLGLQPHRPACKQSYARLLAAKDKNYLLTHEALVPFDEVRPVHSVHRPRAALESFQQHGVRNGALRLVLEVFQVSIVVFVQVADKLGETFGRFEVVRCAITIVMSQEETTRCVKLKIGRVLKFELTNKRKKFKTYV